MNWLVYISGWFIGWAIFNRLFDIDNKDPKDRDWLLYFKSIAWTMLWIWICWKFIR